MNATVQLFSVPKLGNTEEEYEDAAAFSLPDQRFAIADGATESSFADRWAQSLVKQFTGTPPASLDDNNVLTSWLAPLQELWHAGIKWDQLPWYAEEKARSGAFAAFLGVKFGLFQFPAHRRTLWGWLKPKPKVKGPSFGWRSIAIGDTCLFQIRNGKLAVAFPLKASSAFNDRPFLVSSNPSRNQSLWSAIQHAQGDCLAGDVFILATDALSKWFLTECEAGKHPWEVLMQLASPGDFTGLIDRLREQKNLKNDDTTLLILQWKNDPSASQKEITQ